MTLIRFMFAFLSGVAFGTSLDMFRAGKKVDGCIFWVASVLSAIPAFYL